MIQCQLCGGNNFKTNPFYYLWNNKEFPLVKCSSCGLITLNPKPNAEELEKLYSEDYFDTGAHGLNQHEGNYETARDKKTIDERKEYLQENILKYNKDISSLFEIGYAMGHLLFAAQQQGLKVNGVEFSEFAAKRANDKFNLNLMNGDFEKMDLSSHENKWDCVFGGDVFEHFANPDIVAQRIYKMLSSNGICVLIIPSTYNLFSTKLAVILYKLLGKRKKLYDNPYHLYEYTTSTISKILLKHFSKVEVINKIKKPSELNMKNKSLEYRLKYLIHLINYPYTRLFNRNGDRLLVIAYK
jgi:2-polyprenyl-3-methyl-5-hydroxy-6-metoxy-1,4-benzoquinol methylase